VLRIVPTDKVAPTTGEVAIDVRAAGVNHVDYTRYADPAGAKKHREGDYPFPMKLGVEVSEAPTTRSTSTRSL
jgi:NADPH:quinone reductase-like Zn-dependent oxidoreductase